MIYEHLVSYVIAALLAFTGVEASPDALPLARAIAATAIERPVVGSAQATALMLASIAAGESQLRPEVLDCRVTGDGGRSRGAFQIWGAPRQVCTDWQFAAHMALTIVEDSLRVCHDLTAYCSGKCGVAKKIANHYQSRARRFARDHPLLPPID